MNPANPKPAEQASPLKAPLSFLGVHPDVRIRAVHLVILVLACVVVYWNIQGNAFVWDDTLQIVRNKLIRDWGNLTQAFEQPFWGFFGAGRRIISNYYRPLHAVVYMVDYHLFGLNPLGYHWISALFHIGCTALVYLIALRLLAHPPASLVAGLVFATHPIHTESVTWIAGITDPLCALFLFLSFYFYLTILPPGAPAGQSPRLGPYGWRAAITLLAFLFALFAKEVALIFPLLLILYHTTLHPWRNLFTRAGLVLFAGFLAIPVVYLALRIHALGSFAPQPNRHALEPYAYVLSVFELVARYGWKLLVPAPFNAYHVFSPASTLRDAHTLLSSLFVVSFVIVILVLLWRKRLPLVVFSFAWIGITLLPVLNIRAVGQNVFAERYLYIPSFGFCLVLGGVFAWWQSRQAILPVPSRKAVAWILTVVLLSFYGWLTIRRNRDWKDEFTLYSRTLEVSPNATAFHNGLARGYLNFRKDLEGALREHQAALEADKRNYRSDPLEVADAYTGIGTVYLLQGKKQQAQEYFFFALSVYPHHDAFLNLGVIAWHEGRLEEALVLFQQSLRHFPIYERAHNNIGAIYLQRGELNRAEEHFKQALELDSNYIDPRINLATLYVRGNQPQRALEQYQAILQIDPANAHARQAIEEIQRLLNSPTN